MALHLVPASQHSTSRMSSSDRPPPKKPQRRFQFIDNSNIGSSSANSTQVRRHVMQEYMREKRWESRARAEGEVLDLSAQPHAPRTSTATPPRKKASPKYRSKNRVSANATLKTNAVFTNQRLHANEQQQKQQHHHHHSVQQPNPILYDHRQPPLQATQPPNQPAQDVVEEIPRRFAPATKLEHHRPRQGFYLTPQAFATIADIAEIPSRVSPTTTISGDDLSSISSASSLSNRPPHRRSSSSPRLRTVLSAARTDPFNALPMRLSKEDQELFDFYATVMPACSYGFERRKPQAHNWYLSVFIPEAMKSPVAFENTVLVHAANTQAWVRGLPETALTIEHRARASEMLSKHFRDNPFDTSDAAISSTLSAAALEDFDPRRERRPYAWMHWHAAMQKIRDRGGPIALEQNNSLKMLINWSDYIFSGYNGYGSTFFFDHRSSPKHSTDADAEVVARKEIVHQCEDFIIFLKCAESLALVAATVKGNLFGRKEQPLRYSLFEPGQPLYNLIASPNHARYTETGQLKQTISRLAVLMTINVAIWEYRYSPAIQEEFFSELADNIRHNDLDKHISVEALLQILLSGSKRPNLVQTERPWLVGRLLKVAKRLSRDSWVQLNGFLQQCLILGPDMRPIMEHWESPLRTEILSAPMVSYVLPLMQPA